MKTRKIYSAAQKFSAALELIKGIKTAVEIARDVGCHPTIIAAWKDKLEQGGKTIFESEIAEQEKDKKIAKLERLIGKITVQNDFLEHVLEHAR
jgi:transposase